MGEQLLGKILNGKYRLLSVLGEGAMGMVYRAEQLDVKGRPLREVALKTLRPALSSDENFSRRFLDEVRVAAQLRSAHVVTLYDVGTDEDGHLYYTMEFVRGQTLKEVIQRDGPLPLPRVVDIVQQICEALLEAHSLPYPIVHRDLKPANIFIEQRRSEELVKVGDFGIAKILGEQHTQHTAVGTPGPGTPRYMAPEQWKGQELSNRTDLYSLGCMIYELLTATPPFVAQGGGIEALMYQHLTQAPPLLPATIPVEIRSLVERLMAKEPAERPQDALIVSQTLTAILTGTEEQKTMILALPEREKTREGQSNQSPLQKEVASGQEIARSRAASSPQLQEKSYDYKQKEIPQARKSRRVIAWGAVALAIFFGGKVLLSRGGGERFWLKTETKPQPVSNLERKDDVALPRKAPISEAAKDEQAQARVTKPDNTLQEDQKATRETAVSQSGPNEKPPRDQSPPLPSVSASVDTRPSEPPQSPPQGSLSVAVNVEAAKVSLNGKYIGIARSGTPLEITKLAVGQQQVRVEADGYESMAYAANIQDGKLTKLEFPLARLLERTQPVPLSPLANRPPPTPPPTPADQRPASAPPSENEDSPAVIFYGPDGKPISQSQLERKQQMLGNRERRGMLSPSIAPLVPRNRQILRDFPRLRPMLPRNRDGRFSAQ